MPGLATDQTIARISSSTRSCDACSISRLRLARPRDQAGDLGGGLGALVAGENPFVLAHLETPDCARRPLAKAQAKCQWIGA